MRTSLAIGLLLMSTSFTLSAAHFRDGGFLAEEGVLEAIQIEPRLPASGDGFSVNLKGSWPDVSKSSTISGEKYPCYPAPKIDSVVVYADNFVQLITNLQHDADLCDLPPAQWDFDVDIPADAWDAVDQDGFLIIEHLMSSGGVNMLTGINQVFDMRYGTHVVPSWLGTGFWVSEARPFEGIMIEQQGSRVLFYGLGYDREASKGDDGEPVWLMNSGEMRGDSTLGRAYRFDWPLENGQPVELPTTTELLTHNDSGSIIVNDYNHVRVFTGTINNRGLYEDYQRLEFGVDRSRLPVYVPPLAGQWTLYGYSDQEPAFTASFQMLEGEPAGANEYRFESAEGDWSARCDVVPPGDGNCQMTRASDEAAFDFPVSAFQGNLARGSLDAGMSADLVGILVRHPWQLPN
jgi:hypothetical protein